MSLLNPMNITGPNSPGNYVQPNTQNPMPNPAVANFPVGANALVYPIPPPADGNTPLDNPTNPQVLGVFPHLVS
jgi:hypothetical protein